MRRFPSVSAIDAAQPGRGQSAQTAGLSVGRLPWNSFKGTRVRFACPDGRCICPRPLGGVDKKLLRFVVVIGLFYQLFRLVSRPFLAHAFCSHWHCLTDLLYQPEAHCVSANFTAREQIARPQQDFVRLPMRAVNHLINPAPAAECIGKKIVSGIDAFHRTSSLNRRQSRSGACGAAVPN